MEIEQNNYAEARTLATWKDKVKQAWPELQLYVEGQREGQISLGQSIDMRAWVQTDKLKPEDFNKLRISYTEKLNEQVFARNVIIKKIMDDNSRLDALSQDADKTLKTIKGLLI